MLKKYLDAIHIDKYVDPGLGEVETQNPADTRPIPQKIIKTPASILIEDLKVQVKETTAYVQNTIDSIVEINKTDSNFSKYYQEVINSVFNPITLETNPDAQPPQQVKYEYLKALQQDIYERATDPRAPFILDLQQMLSEIGLSSYYLNNIWSNLIVPNDLYDTFNEQDRLVKYSLFKEQQHLNIIRGQAARVNNTTLSKLSQCFVDGLVERVFSQAGPIQLAETATSLNKIIKTLEQIRFVLNLTQISLKGDWTKMGTDLGRIFGDFYKYTVDRVITGAAYGILASIQNPILDFTNEIEKVVGISGGYCTDLFELRHQLSIALNQNMGAIENDLVMRERIIESTEELRSTLVNNATKAGKNKQFIHALDIAIVELVTLRNSLIDSNDFFNLAKERTKISLLRGVSSYGNHPYLREPSTIPQY